MTSTASIIGFPILSFLLLLFFSTRMSKKLIAIVGAGGIVLSCVSAIALGLTTTLPYQETWWRLLPAGIINEKTLHFGLVVDSLSLTMVLVVTFVSSLIALYSIEYMAHEEGFGRFFACINLFVAFMLLLVLGDSLWLLFIGWEGVGLASYLLIGFFYREPQAVRAAMKAFLTTRVGDIFLLFGLFFSLVAFSTLDIASMKSLATTYPQGSLLITLICLCMLGGACGKSAQLPLQTWLADAMWGPTPVSALIHAATMVTAGVYLLVRMSFLVALSPFAQITIMAVGLATLIMAGLSALVQTDMKRVLAYSTMSQIGYMFLAVGALSFQAAIFHLVTHAFFKALLFLSAGIIGHAIHSYDLTKMSGLRKSLPAVFWFFVIGSASLMALPLIGAGFFSKEWILNDVVMVPHIGNYLFTGAVFGTFLTALYTVRMLTLAFTDNKKATLHHTGRAMYGTVTVLAIFSLLIGWINTPHFLANIHVMVDFLSSSVPRTDRDGGSFLWFIPFAASALGAIIAYSRHKSSRRARASTLTVLAKNGFGFDTLYQELVVKPYQRIAQRLQGDVIKTSYGHLLHGLENFFALIAAMHTGRLSHYLSFMMVAVVALASIMVLS